MSKSKYIGYQPADYTTPYAKFYNETILPVSAQITKALEQSPHPLQNFITLANASTLTNKGYFEVETGYCLNPDGSVCVSVLTTMPNVQPCMWDWWFGWHGCQANRYKLWHPKAHLSAQWHDGNQKQETYIGRTSAIEEYIGNSLEKANICFLHPNKLGIVAANYPNEVFICARIGYTNLPLDFGWLVHQVRPIEGGSEMRSRFWMGGEHIQLRIKGVVPQMASKILQKLKTISKQQAQDLLIHCSEEMNHLATILPQLYTQYHQ